MKEYAIVSTTAIYTVVSSFEEPQRVAKVEKIFYLCQNNIKNSNIMKHAYVFPGQGAQAVGMGKDLYDNVPEAKVLFEKANEILGFRITDIMFAGTPDELKQTKVTQPAVFLHSVILAKALGVKPDMVAGHSLGEFSALVVAGALSFEDGLRLVSKRALAMQAACEAQPGTMAAILGLPDEVVEEACQKIDGVVVAANYNCPGQLVISGACEAVDAACEALKAVGARRALRLPVGGAFHSPLMEPARAELAKAIAEAPIHTPTCPIYQNVDAKPQTDPTVIRKNLIAQLTAPVRWTYIVKNMLADGATSFTELGPGNVLQGLVKKVNSEVAVESRSTL
jgi:[acyl-carrier-protein] S-malonyltransferase